MSTSLRPVCALCRSARLGSQLGQVRSSSALTDAPISETLTVPGGYDGSRPSDGSSSGPASRSAIEALRDKMNSSPIRQCVVTKQSLPSDYLIPFFPSPGKSDKSSIHLTLSPRINTPRQPNTIPDIPNNKGIWVSCRRDAVASLTTRGPHLSVLRHSQILDVPSDIADQVETQLSRRVLAEANTLIRRREGRIVAEAKKRKFASPKKCTPIGHGQIMRRMPQSPMEGKMEKGRDIMAIIDTHSTDSGVDSSTLLTSVLASGIPMFNLRQLFPISELGTISQAIENAIIIETAALPHPLPDDNSSSVAVQSWSDLGTGGMAGWPLVKALLRLRMFSGQGWVEVDGH